MKNSNVFGGKTVKTQESPRTPKKKKKRPSTRTRILMKRRRKDSQAAAGQKGQVSTPTTPPNRTKNLTKNSKSRIQIDLSKQPLDETEPKLVSSNKTPQSAHSTTGTPEEQVLTPEHDVHHYPTARGPEGGRGEISLETSTTTSNGDGKTTRDKTKQ